jgi:hypothetical protein
MALSRSLCRGMHPHTIKAAHIIITHAHNTGLGGETYLVCFAIEPGGERTLGRLVFECVLHRRRIRLDQQRLVHLLKTNQTRPQAINADCNAKGRRNFRWTVRRGCRVSAARLVPKPDSNVVTKAA